MGTLCWARAASWRERVPQITWCHWVDTDYTKRPVFVKVPATQSEASDNKAALIHALPSSDAIFPAQHSLLSFSFTCGKIFGGCGNKFLHMGFMHKHNRPQQRMWTHPQRQVWSI